MIRMRAWYIPRLYSCGVAAVLYCGEDVTDTPSPSECVWVPDWGDTFK